MPPFRYHRERDKLTPGLFPPVDKNQTIVCIVGQKITRQKGVLDKIFSSLGDVPIRMVSCGGSYNNISILVDTALKEQVLISLNKDLFGLS